jgi:hypothetical protein
LRYTFSGFFDCTTYANTNWKCRRSCIANENCLWSTTRWFNGKLLSSMIRHNLSKIEQVFLFN